VSVPLLAEAFVLVPVESFGICGELRSRWHLMLCNTMMYVGTGPVAEQDNFLKVCPGNQEPSLVFSGGLVFYNRLNCRCADCRAKRSVGLSCLIQHFKCLHVYCFRRQARPAAFDPVLSFVIASWLRMVPRQPVKLHARNAAYQALLETRCGRVFQVKRRPCEVCAQTSCDIHNC
jgi:hypothetical protein